MKLPAAPAFVPDHWALPGFDPAWSRLVTADTVDGGRTFHILDTGPTLEAAGRIPTGTILAVHGNPTWSYLWRSVAAATVQAAEQGPAAQVWRVVAVDQLDMGCSERLPHDGLPVPATAQESGQHSTARGYRTLTGRIADLDALVHELGLDTQARQGHRLVTLGHDWGGVVSLGWAGRNQDLVSAVMTLNTAVHQRPEDPLPAPLRAALAGPLLAGSTVVTDAFLRITTALGHPSLTEQVKGGFHAPYSADADPNTSSTAAERRGGIGGFVADIPVDPSHGSHAELHRVSSDLTRLGASGIPALILWGPKDPVFLDRYLADLLERLPQADVHRFEKAGHLLPEDVDISVPILLWLDRALPASGSANATTTAPAVSEPSSGVASWSAGQRPLWSFLDEWRDQDTVALVDLAGSHPGEVTWERLASVVDAVACGLSERGVRAGDRVSLMVPPGRDLTAILYACLRLGAVGVVADAGLGVAGMMRAVRAARPQWVIGELPGLTIARVQSWPGRRISVRTHSSVVAAGLGVEDSIHAMMDRHAGGRFTGAAPGPEAPAAILFTSGSTGPAKGVMYTHGRLAALAALLRDVFDVRPGSSLLAGFAPFALLGPAIGATSATPDMSVTEPASLTAHAVAEAVEAAGATIVFGSPAALRNVVATAEELDDAQRSTLAGVSLVLSAGAPVLPELMAQVAQVFPEAEIHSPYGMTESLLLTDIDRDTVEQVTTGSTGQYGVCVGHPVGPVRVAIAPLSADGTSSDTLLEGTEAVGILGEVVVSAPHMKAGYDRLWLTDARSKRDSTFGRDWHRTQDVGHLDDDGRLWIEGRLQHVVTSPEGPVAPGGPEARIDALDGVHRSAVVGVGPVGTQAVVAVVEPSPQPGTRTPRPGLADAELTREVREAAAPVAVSAVLVTDTVPVDIRHQSKIDRTRLAGWADRVLSGGKVGRP